MRLNRRSKLLIFRVTPEEYDLIETAQINSGARTLSKYVRAAVLSAAQYDREMRGFSAEDVEEMKKIISAPCGIGRTEL